MAAGCSRSDGSELSSKTASRMTRSVTSDRYWPKIVFSSTNSGHKVSSTNDLQTLAMTVVYRWPR